MAKERENRKKEKKDKEERKEKKRREAEELAIKEKKISKKHKSEKSKKKSKKPQVEEVEEEKPLKKSKKKQKKLDEEESEPQTQLDDPPLPLPTTNESESDFEFDKEDIKYLLESYTKEELINLIYKTAEKGSKLLTVVFESADRDSLQRNIFVRGLGWDTTQENLKTAFGVYGEIEECSVVMDKDTGRAKGYGFVLFKTRKGAREALRNPDKRMFNRTVSCNMAAAKPSGGGKPREVVETVKIDLGNQSEMGLPGVEFGNGHGHGFDKGHQQQQNVGMYGGQNMPFCGHAQPPVYNPMYGAFMGNQGPLMVPNYRMFGPGMMNQGPPNHMGMTGPPNPMGIAGQYAGEGNGNGAGVGAGFDERAWYLR